ncbi:MAG: N-acetylglucosamine kinase [Pararhodobacter sp.]|nr:N-acetylglucosamine kinase [Pararhodobacter sp.]
MAWLGVDMGGTASRWVLLGTGGVIARGTAPGATALRADETQRAAFDAALASIRQALPCAPHTACLGLTGAGHAPGATLADACARPLRLPVTAVRVMNDATLAWHAAFPQGGAGLLVLAGTGSVGLGRALRGPMIEVGGRGALIDDGGSAVWIVLRALDMIFRRIDQTGTPDDCAALADALFTAIGARDWDTVCARVHTLPRGELGALALSVARAAHAGDPQAAALLARAGDELARLARALATRCGPAPLVMAGGVLALSPAITARLHQALPGLEPQCATLDAALAGGRLAQAIQKDTTR